VQLKGHARRFHSPANQRHIDAKGLCEALFCAVDVELAGGLCDAARRIALNAEAERGLGALCEQHGKAGIEQRQQRVAVLNDGAVGREQAVCAEKIEQGSAVRLRIMGEDWLLMMDAVRYGDKWYNMNSMGTLALFCNLNVLTGGLAPESELN